MAGPEVRLDKTGGAVARAQRRSTHRKTDDMCHRSRPDGGEAKGVAGCERIPNPTFTMADIHKLPPADSAASIAAQTDPKRHEAIARRAHELWRQQGEPGGRDLAIWLEAERLIGAEEPVLPASVDTGASGKDASVRRKPRR